MWVIIIIIVVLIVFGLIRGTKLQEGYFDVINSKGHILNCGTYSECVTFIKAEKDFCKSFGINERFQIKKKW